MSTLSKFVNYKQFMNANQGAANTLADREIGKLERQAGDVWSRLNDQAADLETTELQNNNLQRQAREIGTTDNLAARYGNMFDAVLAGGSGRFAAQRDRWGQNAGKIAEAKTKRDASRQKIKLGTTGGTSMQDYGATATPIDMREMTSSELAERERKKKADAFRTRGGAWEQY